MEFDLKFDRIIQTATTWMDNIDGVTGVAQGKTEDGHNAVIVYASNAEVENKLPNILEGVPVVVKITDSFKAF